MGDLGAPFDVPRTAVSKFVLTEGSGLGSCKQPPVATEAIVDSFNSFSNSSHIESRSIRQISEASSISCDYSISPDQNCDDEADNMMNVFEDDENDPQYSVPDHQNAINHTFVSNQSLPTEMKWDYIIVDDVMLFSLPPEAHKQKGFRDGFVEFLEHGEDVLDCSCAVLAIERDEVDKERQMSTYRFLGFSLMAPNVVPVGLSSLVDDYILMVSPFKFDDGSEYDDE